MSPQFCRKVDFLSTTSCAGEGNGFYLFFNSESSRRSTDVDILKTQVMRKYAKKWSSDFLSSSTKFCEHVSSICSFLNFVRNFAMCLFCQPILVLKIRQYS